MNSCNSGSASSLECQAAPGTISNSSVEKKLAATALTLLYCQAAEAVPALGRVALGRRLREGGKGAEDECGCCCTAFPVHTTSFCAALLQAAFQERTSDRGVDRRDRARAWMRRTARRPDRLPTALAEIDQLRASK